MSSAVSVTTLTTTPIHSSLAKTRTRTKKREVVADYLPDPKTAGIHNSLLGTRVTGHMSFVEIRLVSSGINRTISNTSHPSPISRI
jgi:hypothetical protein